MRIGGYGLVPLLMVTTLGACSRHDPKDPRAVFKFEMAILENDRDDVKAWLKAGLPPNQPPTGDQCDTPLSIAARFRDSEMIQWFLDAGADVNAKADNHERTALMCAAQNYQGDGNIDVLVQKGASVNAKDDSGWTALMYAANGGHEKNLVRLLAAGSEVNAVNVEGQTAIQLADAADDDEAVEVLKSAGASTRKLAKRWEVASLQTVRSVNGIHEGVTWDDALPNLGLRIGKPVYSGEHAFTDTREIRSQVYEITFRRPAVGDEVMGPYRVTAIKRQVLKEIPR